MIEREEFRELEKTVNSTSREVGTLQQQVRTLESLITQLVTRAEFTPIKLIAYGLATTVMSSMLLAIIARVIIK
jgi:uncharacterized protein YlxW (UPF0749 family)